RFYLKHPDDKGDYILVDDTLNITSVIDWEWTRTASWAEAFSSPCMMWPVGSFYEGSNELSDDEERFARLFRERGRHDLADCVVHGRKVQRFFFAFGPGGGVLRDKETVSGLLGGLEQAFSPLNK
ncbi:hypothetical protein B0T26DRAFT_641885, partial [Lasiosphaeria miniovina]